MRYPFRLKRDRALAAKGYRQLLIPAISASVCFIIACVIWLADSKWIFSRNATITGDYKINNIWDGAFYSLFANGGQNLFPGNHLCGLFITILGVLVVALITSVITNMFEKMAEGYLNGETAYKLKNHIVIMGANDVIYSIISQKYKEKQFILIQTSKDVKQTRNEVFSFLSDKIKQKYIVFIYGDRTSPADIKKLNLAQASEIFIIGDTREGEEHESYRDAYNMDSVNAVAKELNNDSSDRHIDCHVLFEYQTTFSAFQFAELSEDIKKHIVFRPFNFHEMWAQKVLLGGNSSSDGGACSYKFLDETKVGTFISEHSEDTVHLIIIGMSKMGVSLAIEAAHMLHFPNFVKDPKKKTRITFIDENADKEKDFFTGRFKELFRLSTYRYAEADAVEDSSLSLNDAPWITPAEDWLDIEWEFIKGRVEQGCVQNYIADAAQCPNRAVTVAICLPMSHQAIAAALYLPDSVYKNCLQILTYQRLSSYIVNNIAGAYSEKEVEYRYAKLRPFGMIDEGYDSRLDDETRAMMVSYVYDSFYTHGACDVEFSHYSKEEYKKIWISKKSVSDRWSSIFNANTIDLKLRSVGCKPSAGEDDIRLKVSANLDIMAAVEHNRWNIEKLLTGYRALTKEEQESISKLRKDGLKDNFKRWSDYRGTLKNWPEKAHLDLCSNEKLAVVDPDICHFDVDLSKAIPNIVSATK